MPLMPRLSLILLLCLLSGGAGAQSLYKCRVDGTLTYSGSPCAGTPSTAVEVPEAPTPSPGSEKALARQRESADRLTRERVKRETAEARQEQSRARQGEAQRQRCGKLRLQKKWADEAVAASTDANRGRAETKARRAQEALILACPL